MTKIEIMAGVVAGFVKKYGIFNVSMLLGLPVFGYAHLRLEKKVMEKEESVRIMYEELKAKGQIIEIDE